MEKSIHKVRKKAKKHKKWFEKISVNPFPWEINERFYFLVAYMKSSYIQGEAIISDKDSLTQEAKKAHQPLFLFYRLMNHIHSTGQPRVSIHPSFFQAPLELSATKSAAALEEGQTLIQTLYDKQTEFKDVFEHFFSHLSRLQRQKRPISDEELDLAIHTSASLEIIQYEIMKETAENFEVLSAWIEEMKNQGLWDDMKQNHRVFFLEMARNEEKLRSALLAMPIVKHKNPEKMLKLTKEKYAKYKDEERKKDLNQLRYP
ncbi:hypothetical protein CR194_16350 [Salipaludibacillus keqinensis]|uniref:Uncharacterized protein n=1 Tax=Salipaludibacillus keqinensis TaxID=2045207 RepID=A0A323TB11_9BACI|nr:hypothetical protein CR194_16350 [Salipaludibacillus keqinensis]